MSIFRYSDRVGPGVSKDAPKSPGYMRFIKVFFGRLSSMITINIVYLFACIPIFTIGPATAGFTYVMRNYSQNKYVEAMHDFRIKCKEHFKKGFIVFIADLIISALLYISITWWYHYEMVGLQIIVFVVLLYFSYIFICANLYIFPMMVSFDLPLKKLIRNSFILASTQFARNIAMILFDGIFTGLIYLFWPIPLPLLIGCHLSWCALFNNMIIYPVLVKKIATPVNEKSTEEDENVIFHDKT